MKRSFILFGRLIFQLISDALDKIPGWMAYIDSRSVIVNLNRLQIYSATSD